ncbi:ATP-binding protein [Desemzia sp. RIT 804]|uniref:sensor histidine kinase n=1 Tax=Desemzia sp. RIT 804 TaxID=2810209 RepID=UPI001F2753DC|nr:ATP-binding protein [Desemzia sp. RIT 804]
MRVTNISTKIWLIIMGIIGLFFFTCILSFRSLYNQSIERQYISEFEETIQETENYAETNPQQFLDQLNSINNANMHIQYMTFNDEDLAQQVDLNNLGLTDFQQEVIEDPEVLSVLVERDDAQVIQTIRQENRLKVPFILRVYNFEANQQNMLLISFGDLSFLNEVQSSFRDWVAIIVVLYLIIGVWSFYYLKKRLGEPVTELRDIAFDYATNDFSRKAQVRHKDELSQLGLAMNKMARSLETSGAATRQEKELLENIVTSITTGILYYNQDKTLLMSNPSGEEFLENSEQGYLLEDVRVPGFLQKKMEEVISSSEKMQFEHIANDFYYEVYIIPLFDENIESVRGVLVSAQDITQERRLDTMRNDFINNVSHELRTPLVMIQGYSEAIVDDVAETTEEKHEMAKIIGEESRRMNRMVNEMLDLSRVESGYITLEKTTVNLSEFFNQLFSRFNTMASNGNVELSLEIQPNLETYIMDRDKMDQVFVNLVNNAIRHTIMADRERGQVKIKVYLDVIVDEVLMEVQDNGTGIPEVDIPFVFERFYKADKSRATQRDNRIGTGIGLSLVKNIVEAHDGYVEVKSELSNGSSFIVHMPYIDEKEINIEENN